MASPAGGGLAGAGAEQVSGKPLARNLRSLMHRPSLHLPQRSLAPSDHEFCVLAVTQVSLFLPGCGDGLSLCSMPHAAATAWHPTGTLPWLVLLVPLCSHCTCQSGFVPGWTCLSQICCVCLRRRFSFSSSVVPWRQLMKHKLRRMQLSAAPSLAATSSRAHGRSALVPFFRRPCRVHLLLTPACRARPSHTAVARNLLSTPWLHSMGCRLVAPSPRFG